jgi:hypothetical protein
MRSSITPFGERGRNQRWWITMAAFVTGSIVGGAVVGGLLGGLGGAMLGSAPAATRLLALGFAADRRSRP